VRQQRREAAETAAAAVDDGVVFFFCTVFERFMVVSIGAIFGAKWCYFVYCLAVVFCASC